MAAVIESSQRVVMPLATASSFELKYRKNVARSHLRRLRDPLDGDPGQAVLGDPFGGRRGDTGAGGPLPAHVEAFPPFRL